MLKNYTIVRHCRLLSCYDLTNTSYLNVLYLRDLTNTSYLNVFYLCDLTNTSYLNVFYLRKQWSIYFTHFTSCGQHNNLNNSKNNTIISKDKLYACNMAYIMGLQVYVFSEMFLEKMVHCLTQETCMSTALV